MKVFQTSLKGIRDQNEDKHLVLTNKEFGIKDNIILLGVFDGHGGKNVSKYLFENIPNLFLKKGLKYPLNKKYINDTLDTVQNNLKKTKFGQETGSTCLLSMLHTENKNTIITVINTGDSRCVLCRDNLAIPLSKDHKPMWPEEKVRIEKLGGKITFDGDYRIKSLSVSRAFGDASSSPFVTHKPDIFKYKIEKNDKFIVLACDGLWDVMDNQAVINFILLNSYNGNNILNPPNTIAKKLGEHAIQIGSTDNITIIILFF